MKTAALHVTCQTCMGHGRVPVEPDGPGVKLCTECRGMGFVPTAEGRSIIDLIRVAGFQELVPEAGV